MGIDLFPGPGTLRILLVGDSIVRAVNCGPNVKVDCWPGRKLVQLSSMLVDRQRYDLTPFGVVVLHAGTNDLLSVSVISMISHVENLIKSYRSQYQGHIAFSCVIPRPKDEALTMAKRKCFNEKLMETCQNLGCLCLRTYGPFTRGGMPRRDLYKPDGIHPRPWGPPPTGLFVLQNFLRSQLSTKTLIPRLRALEWAFYAGGQ